MLMKLRERSTTLRRTLRRVSALLPRLVSLACAVLLLGPLLVLAQSDKQVWVQRFGTTYGSKELARSIARDSAGNVVVAGDSDEGGLGSAILVIKYSPAGQGLWTNRYNIPGDDHAAAVALDGNGNVFVTGSSGSQFVMFAYSSLGVPLWTNQFNESAGPSYTERPSAPAVDNSGNVFITGPSHVGGSVAFATLKYSSAGVPLWTNIFVPTDNVGYLASALAVDNAGNVVVRGGKYTIKYAGNGVPIWTNRCPGAGFLLDLPRSLAMDGTGNVLLMGQSDGAGNFPNDLIVKYSGDGVALWTNRYPGYGQSLAIDPAGNAAVTGDLFPGSHSAIATIKYSAAGTPVWTNQYDLDASNFPFTTVAAGSNGDIFVSGYSPYGVDQVTIKYSGAGSALWTRDVHTGSEWDEDYPRPHPALVIDPSGNALVTGYFFNDYTTDFIVRKYDAGGTEVWASSYDGNVKVSSSPSAVAVDSSGNIIVTGGGHRDFATIKYSPSGVALWTNYCDGPAHLWDSATALTIASNGNIVVTGESYPAYYEEVEPEFLTVAYTGAGVPLWTNRYISAALPVAIVADGNGDVIVSGNGEIAWGDGGWVTIKYSAAGVPLWTNYHKGVDPEPENPRGFVQGLAVDGNSDVVVVGSSYPYFAAIKYSSSGSALWTNRYGSESGFAEARAVAIRTNGDIFVTGSTYVETDSDFLTIKYSAAGVPLWTNLYDGPAMLYDSARAVALDGSGNVVITGYSQSTNGGGDLITIKYSNDGAVLWMKRYAGPGTPHAVAVDRNDNVFVTGGSSADSVTVAYSSEGMPLWTNRYDGPSDYWSAAPALAVTGLGDVVVLASSDGDYATVKYESGFALNITSPPHGQVNNAGTTATFSVGVAGTAPFTFQWQRNGANLVNGGNISGATTSNLTLTSVTASDAGSYTVVISNPAGSVTSVVAVLSVPVFENVTATVAPCLPQLNASAMAWGDYDNDGRLDFLLTGWFYDAGHEVYVSQLWHNTGSGFTNVTSTAAPGLSQVGYASVAWGDYDNDGRLDLLITGSPHEEAYLSQIWRNTGSGFTKVMNLSGVGYGSAAWGDYDNDGRLDFLITGFNEGDFYGQLWRNTGSGFSNVTPSAAPGLPAVYGSSVAWADFDQDGRLDFLITGLSGTGSVSQLWRNTGSGFTDVTSTVAPGLPRVSGSSVAWGDYDNDGRLDFLLAGFEGDDFICQLWRNTGSGFTNVIGAFTPSGMSAPSPISSSVAWGDYDNDGRLDVLLSGRGYPTGSVAQLWRNTGSGFENVTPDWPADVSSASWADYDNDGRLDFFLSGPSQLWRNNTPVTNTPPSAPTGLAMTASSNAVMLSWNSATDGQTPASGLTYNVRAGTTPGGNNLLSAHVNATNGFRRVPALGNAMLRHSLPLIGLTNGQTVYWSVQAVDSAFAGGPFATETSVVIQPVLSVSLHSQPSTLNLSWTPPTFGWVLQQSSALNVSNWTTTASGSANPATLPATNGAQFYRLSKP
jgi:hypothetical protein